jgi:hypothetical protein
LDKTKKPPIPEKSGKAPEPKPASTDPRYVRGTIDPTTKK